jgi:hypothetical protein
MNAWKSLPQPYPGSFACSLLFYAYYDRELHTAKKLQEIKTELQICAERWRETQCCLDRSGESSKGSKSDCVFFRAIERRRPTTRSLDSNNTPLRQIALGRLAVRIGFAATA